MSEANEVRPWSFPKASATYLELSLMKYGTAPAVAMRAALPCAQLLNDSGTLSMELELSEDCSGSRDCAVSEGDLL